MNNPKQKLYDGATRKLLQFGLEGLLFQFGASLGSASSSTTLLYAVNLGATDNQLGVVQLLPNLLAAILLIPMGILCDRTKRARTVPAAILFVLGAMFGLFATVPALGRFRMPFFFVTVTLCAGLISAYNSIWQTFFSDVTTPEDQSRVYTFRSRCVAVMNMIAPVICGAMLTACADIADKLKIIRVFFYLCGVMSILAGITLMRIDRKKRTFSSSRISETFSIKDLAVSVRELMKNRRFIIYLLCVMSFYVFWDMDWSLWFICQQQYLMLSELDMSIASTVSSVLQLCTLGWFAANMDRNGLKRTFNLCTTTMATFSVLMIICLNMPAQTRPGAFIIGNSLLNMPMGVLTLCMLQMLLNELPEKNKAFLISIYMTLVTLLTALMPYIGVRIYTAIGGTRKAMLIMMFGIGLCRYGSAILNAWRMNKYGVKPE